MLLTDGSVSNQKEVMDLIKGHCELDGTKLFTIGICDKTNTMNSNNKVKRFVINMAMVGNGHYAIINNVDNLKGQVISLL